jgi:type VI secretion system Hcp family effector
MLVLVRRLITVVIPLVLCVVVVLPSTSWAALNAYLKLPDCAGAVTAAGLAGAIQLNGFTSKAINTTSIGSGGAGTGKAQISPIQVLKDFDNCSPRIFADVVIGTHLQQVTILFTRASKSGKEQPFFKITLTDVLITGIEATTVARTGTEDVRNIQDATAPEVNTGDPTALQEIVTLTFRRIELADLVANTPPVSFDVSENKIQ